MEKDKLIELRKKLLKKVKEELKDYLGKQPKEIERYYNQYRKEFKNDYKKVSSKKELIKKIKKAEIVLCGDYHTLKQAQNTAYKIILEVAKKKKLVICLELLNYKKQEHLDKFISGEINEETFLSDIKYNETWGFNFKNYHPIFKAAKNNEIPIYGINEAPNTLQTRDKKAAEYIMEISEKHPGSIIFVLFGDLHIASTHLPKELKALMKKRGKKKKLLQVFQNSESIYWQIQQKEKDPNIVDVVKVKNNVYSIQNTPPWVKLQSFLIWAEHGDVLYNQNAIHPQKDDDEDEDDIEDWENYINPLDVAKDQFFYILDVLCNFFKIDQETLEDPEIQSIEDFNVSKELKDLEKDNLSLYQEIYDQILTRKAYYIPSKNTLLLTSYSLNHAAHTASIYIFYQLAGSKVMSEGNTFDVLRENFYRRVVVDTLGFIGSKIINPKRKCFAYKDHKEYYEKHKFSRKISEMRKKKIAKGTMLHKEWEDKYMSGKVGSIKLRSIYKDDCLVSFGISKTIGYQLGNSMYFAMIYNIIKPSYIQKILTTPFSKENSAYQTYLDILKHLKDYEPVYTSKTEIF